MGKRPLTNKDGEVLSLEHEDFSKALRFTDLPHDMQAKLKSLKSLKTNEPDTLVIKNSAKQ